MRVAAVAALAVVGTPALADGEFLQYDHAAGSSTAVASVVRGPLTFGAAYTNYEDGHAYGVSLGYAISLDGIGTVKLGPSLGGSQDDGSGFEGPNLGAKITFDRYAPTSFGAVYTLAEFNTIDRAWFAMAQVTFSDPGLSIELSRGGSDKYEEATLGIAKRIPDSPVSLRAGWRFFSEEVFVGFSVNTF